MSFSDWLNLRLFYIKKVELFVLNINIMENNSFASTTCSSLQNDSVKKSIKNDSVRYKRKGIIS